MKLVFTRNGEPGSKDKVDFFSQAYSKSAFSQEQLKALEV